MRFNDVHGLGKVLGLALYGGVIGQRFESEAKRQVAKAVPLERLERSTAVQMVSNLLTRHRWKSHMCHAAMTGSCPSSGWEKGVGNAANYLFCLGITVLQLESLETHQLRSKFREAEKLLIDFDCQSINQCCENAR